MRLLPFIVTVVLAWFVAILAERANNHIHDVTESPIFPEDEKTDTVKVRRGPGNIKTSIVKDDYDVADTEGKDRFIHKSNDAALVKREGEETDNEVDKQENEINKYQARTVGTNDIAGRQVTDNDRETMGKVQAGIKATEGIAKLMGDKQFTDLFADFSKISTQITPFLGALGPVVSLITVLLPKQPTPEMKFMKKKFAEIDAKFDETFKKFKDLENLIQKTSLKTQYAPHEINVLALSRYMREFLSSSDTDVNHYKTFFINAYERSYKEDATKLLQGLVSGYPRVVSNNIPTSAMQFFDNDRKRVQGVMKGVLNLVLQAVKVELIYLKSKGRDQHYEIKKRDWEAKIKDAVRKIKKYDDMVTGRWYDQSKKEIENKLSKMRGLDHATFANTLYTFLKGKYDWRDWIVVSYNGISGADNHYVKVCQGVVSFRKHGRNFLISSISRLAPVLNHAEEHRSLDFPTSWEYKAWWGVTKRRYSDARGILTSKMPTKYRNGCQYPLVAVIDKHAGMRFKAHSLRVTIDRAIDNRFMYGVFGKN